MTSSIDPPLLKVDVVLRERQGLPCQVLEEFVFREIDDIGVRLDERRVRDAIDGELHQPVISVALKFHALEDVVG